MLRIGQNLFKNKIKIMTMSGIEIISEIKNSGKEFIEIFSKISGKPYAKRFLPLRYKYIR
jgi:hypothetical protein